MTTGAVRGRDTIDARGLVVAPGFIDLHQHAQDSAAYAAIVRGGTTSVFDLEEGTGDVDARSARRAAPALGAGDSPRARRSRRRPRSPSTVAGARALSGRPRDA